MTTHLVDYVAPVIVNVTGHYVVKDGLRIADMISNTLLGDHPASRKRVDSWLLIWKDDVRTPATAAAA